MNLRSTAVGATSKVNPQMPVVVQSSIGYTTAANGSRTPQYVEFRALADVQSLTADDIQHLEGLNTQVTTRAMYLHGDVKSIERISERGGDVVIMPNGSVWLVTQVIERWRGWAKVAITLQNGS